MKACVQSNWNKVIFIIVVLFAYLWDQDRRSYVLIPDIGVEISTMCHFVELNDLRFCDGQHIKVRLGRKPEVPINLVVMHGTDGNAKSTIIRLSYFSQTVYLPKDTGSVYFDFSSDN